MARQRFMPKAPNKVVEAANAALLAIKKDESPIAEVIAENIVAVADAMRKLRAGRLNDRAIIVLINDVTGIAKRDIRTVLDAMEGLERTYLKKAGK